jgi:hypothetical protein
MQLYDVLISPSGNHAQLACDEPSLSFRCDSLNAEVGVVVQVNCCAWWAQNWDGSLRDAAWTSDVILRDDMMFVKAIGMERLECLRKKEHQSTSDIQL